MSKLGKCCCDCCIDPTEMPWTTVTLKNQLTGCTTGGGYSPPTATFERTNCCYTATFNVSCDWEYTCGLWASQTGTFSFGVDQYKPRVAYVGPGDTASCPCVLVQSRTVSGTVTGRVNFFNRRRLSSIQITVGKTLVQCAEDASPVCRLQYHKLVDFYFSISNVHRHHEQLKRLRRMHRRRRRSNNLVLF